MSEKTPNDSFQLPPDDNGGKMTNEELAKFLEEHSNRLNKMANASSDQPAEFDASQLDLDSLAAEIDKISDAAPWDSTTQGNAAQGNVPNQKIDASNFPDEIPTDINQFSIPKQKDIQQPKSNFEMPNFDLPKQPSEDNRPIIDPVSNIENLVDKVDKTDTGNDLGNFENIDTKKFDAASFDKLQQSPKSDGKQDKNSLFEKGLDTTNAIGGMAAGVAGSTFALGKQALSKESKKEKKQPVTSGSMKVEEPASNFSDKSGGHENNALLKEVPAGIAEPAPAPKKNMVVEEPKKSEGVPFFAFLMLLTYASLATLGLVYFMMQSMNGNSKDLESLPDIVPPMNGDQVMYPLVPESRNMANGHSLSLGTSRRFGNLIVTPVGVTREPLEFVHYTGDESKKREAVKPVLKLWLRFENVSEDQTITPLDRKLMLTRNPDPNDPEWLRSNNFVVKKQNKAKPKKQWLMYDMEINGDWNFADGPNEQEIKPGEKLDTYLPSQVIEEDLDGRMVWRVHFRKGHHPETKNGVTTLIEVLFDDTDIKEPVS